MWSTREKRGKMKKGERNYSGIKIEMIMNMNMNII